MLYYTVRDIGSMNEVLSFMKQARSTEQSKDIFLSHFPDVTESSRYVQPLPSDECANEQTDKTLPHVVVSIMGHAGTGKTHILKHIANRKRTMFYAPTNPAGINLQNTLWPAMLFASSRKCVYKTTHSFYETKPYESDILGRFVQKTRKGRETFSSYEDYVMTMFRGCLPFCEKLLSKDVQAGKISPDDYRKYRSEFEQKYGYSKEQYVHKGVIEYMSSLGLKNKIPAILLYDTCVLEEAGRTPDYLAIPFLFHHAFSHAKYETYAWRHIVPCLLFVGSPTQSRVIDDFTPFSALTFASQPCLKQQITETRRFKIKSFKDNRRVTTGNIQNNTTLASVVSKLKLGRSVCEPLKSQFNEAFVIEEAKFFDPLYKPSYIRICKKHKHLKDFKSNVFRQNAHNTVEFSEFFLTNEDGPSFKNLEGHINVKFKSETYQETWDSQERMAKMFDDEFLVYKTSRTCLKGFRYLLTKYHNVYILSFSGKIQQFLDVTDKLQSYMVSKRSNCIHFFVNCAKYMVEDIYAKQAEHVVKRLNQSNKDDSTSVLIESVVTTSIF